MAKRRSCKDARLKLGSGIAEMCRCRREGLTYKHGRKDGGLTTRPVIPCPFLSEKQVAQECKTWLLKHRIHADRNNVGQFGNYRYGIKSGGDAFVCIEGKHIEIEYKAGKGGVLSLSQQQRKIKIEQSGGIYLIVHGVPELDKFMTPIINTLRPFRLE